jgi:acetolactate synthase I/II/III large subunit
MVDSGCGVAWTGQGFEFKANQRLFSAFNNTPMGYALPASIGASFALGKKPVVCITGDGGLQINIQELATIIRHNLPVKIFTLDNEGYSMIRQTQDQWFESRYVASSVESGLAFPDLEKVAKAYGYKVVSIKRNREAAGKIREVMQSAGPVFCNVKIDPEHRVIPQVKFGRGIEDSEPLLERKEFLENMIVKPLEASENK